MNSRERLLMDPQWKFHRGDIPFPKSHGGWAKSGGFDFGAVSPAFDDASWRLVDLPHDFIVEGEFIANPEPAAGAPVAPNYVHHGSLPAGVAWYRKQFVIPEADLGRRLALEFDGVARDCSVWLNKHFLGRHLSGYTGFRFDITDLVNYGQLNTLAVRVDASEYEGWFYEGGGLYRHTWLVKHAPVHVAPQGVFVTAAISADGGGSAAVTIRTTVRNDGEHDADVRLVSAIADAAGKPVVRGDRNLRIPAGEAIEVQQVLDVPHPALWSVDTPVLYTLESTIRTGTADADQVRTPFGIRSIRFDPNTGFLLNGKPLKLKGVCCHQDHAGVGVALPDALQEFRIKQLKAMGCNAYRTSHNPPTPELLDACDRLGMLVMDETRLLGSSPELLSQQEFLVRRDRNHPSVILWSIGNEEPLQGTDTGARMAASMKRAIRRLDPTRPITLAMNGVWGQGAGQVIDVQGCNYLCTGNADEFHRRFPNQPIFYTEAASTLCTRGIYANDAAQGYVSAYDVNKPSWGNTAEENWTHCLKRPFIAGTFIWTGFDYRGEPTPYAWPCINSHFGILDMCGFPKDNFYYYQAWWSDRNVLHILPHWNWPGREGQPIDVWVHSNCEQVELFLNGRSLGRKQVRVPRHLEWKVPYRPGVLSAKGWRKGRLVATARMPTTGAPAAIRLIPDRDSLRADHEDIALVTVAVVDRQGRVVPTADNEIAFSLAPGGVILGVGNGNPSSHESDKASRRRAFNGLCQVIVQAGGKAGKLQLTARSPGLANGSLVLTARAQARRPYVPGPRVASVPARSLLQEFQCTGLQPAPADICSARPPRQSLRYRPVKPVIPVGFCDIRKFHANRHGLVYIRTVFQARQNGSGLLFYGADGPVKVWVNGKPAGSQPNAANPAMEGQYQTRVQWKEGSNTILFGLLSNHGKAWGVFARGEEKL